MIKAVQSRTALYRIPGIYPSIRNLPYRETRVRRPPRYVSRPCWYLSYTSALYFWPQTFHLVPLQSDWVKNSFQYVGVRPQQRLWFHPSKILTSSVRRRILWICRFRSWWDWSVIILVYHHITQYLHVHTHMRKKKHLTIRSTSTSSFDDIFLKIF